MCFIYCVDVHDFDRTAVVRIVGHIFGPQDKTTHFLLRFCNGNTADEHISVTRNAGFHSRKHNGFTHFRCDGNDGNDGKGHNQCTSVIFPSNVKS